MIKSEDENKSHAAAPMSQCLRFGSCSTSAPIRIMIVEQSLLGVLMNDRPAERASVRPAELYLLPLKRSAR